MSGFFNDDDEDDYAVPSHQPIAGPSRPSRARDSSLSTSSAADPNGHGGSRTFMTRLESTLSPHRSDRFSTGIDEDEMASGMELDGEADEDELDDVRKMGRVWVKERGTVDIMPWEGDLIDTLFDKLEQQQKMVDTLRSDPQTSEEEHFKLVLVQTEMERVKFVIRSYVRTRLHKIERYSHYITLTPDVQDRLSGAERSHAQRYAELLHTHFRHSVLDSLPDWLQKMDDPFAGSTMVSKPNKNVPVLIYCRKDCGEIMLDGDERAELAKGSTHLVKYSLVERWIDIGWAEVL